MEIKTLEQVVAYLRSRGTAELSACAVVCERVLEEQSELIAAVKRLSKRLVRCSEELAKAANNLK